MFYCHLKIRMSLTKSLGLAVWVMTLLVLKADSPKGTKIIHPRLRRVPSLFFL